MEERLLRVRRALATDFTLYAPSALRLRTKEGAIVPFQLNPAQKKLHAAIEDQKRRTGRVRQIILKARQQGFSSYVGGRMYFGISQRKGAKGLVMAHKSDSTTAIFSMVKRFHENCPEALKPSTRYASRRELHFDQLDSGYIVATAGGDAIARGETLTHAHCSEQAFWPSSSAAEIWNGLTDCVPKADGTEIFVESTAQGVSGLFYDNWMAAVKGEGDFEPFFSAWFDTPEYRAEPPAGFQISPEEEELVAKFGLDEAQLYWRRLKISEKGDRDLFRQEYPSFAEEAFLTSGRPVFDADAVAAMLAEARKADRPKLMALSPTEVWEADRRGELKVYEEPQVGRGYVIGADVAKGIKGCDYSVAQVMDDRGRLVASWRGYVLPDHFAKILEQLGAYYHWAELIVEANDHGVLTCYVLQKQLNYPYIHQSTRYDKTTDEQTQVVGFVTNARTKPLIVDKLRSAIRKREVHVPDLDTLRELQTYIVTESGKLEAEHGCHDDTVMALALAFHGLGDMAPPIVSDDSWYAQAI